MSAFSIPAGSATSKDKMQDRDLLCTEHVQTFFFSLFPKQYSIATVYIAYYCIEDCKSSRDNIYREIYTHGIQILHTYKMNLNGI